MSTSSPDSDGERDRARLFLLDLLRTAAAFLIAWHHFALYWPRSGRPTGLGEDLFHWLRDAPRSAAQVFFVIAGFLMASGMARRRWNLRAVGRFMLQRYVRLGLPYLAAVLAAVVAAEIARGHLSAKVVGARATWPQVAAHAVFLQDVLGYESLSAGLWFVCINFQLGMMYVAMLLLRDNLVPPRTEDSIPEKSMNPSAANAESLESGPRRRDLPLLVGFATAASSLFYFNLHDAWDCWALYFFPSFFVGTVVHAALESRGGRRLGQAFALLCLVALACEWRWRLATALGAGLVLYLGGRLCGPVAPGVRQGIEYFGKASYSLFLVHFPILLLTATLWVRLEWDRPAFAWCGLLVAFAASLAAMWIFHRLIEEPTVALSRRIKH